MGKLSRQPRISLGSCLSIWQTLLRDSCGAFWTMPPRSYSWIPRHNYPKSLPQQTFCSTQDSASRHHRRAIYHTRTEFWILPLYRELLNSARRIWPSAASERARGCTGLVKLICKENKEQRGKRKFHAGTPHPNDRGGFTQWFGSCSLISTLYVWLWFPASWASMVAERLFAGGPFQGVHPIHSVVSLLQDLPRCTLEHILGTNILWGAFNLMVKKLYFQGPKIWTPSLRQSALR